MPSVTDAKYDCDRWLSCTDIEYLFCVCLFLPSVQIVVI